MTTVEVKQIAPENERIRQYLALVFCVIISVLTGVAALNEFQFYRQLNSHSLIERLELLQESARVLIYTSSIMAIGAYVGLLWMLYEFGFSLRKKDIETPEAERRFNRAIHIVVVATLFPPLTYYLLHICV